VVEYDEDEDAAILKYICKNYKVGQFENLG
jgi:hypothetical protein